MVIKKLVFIALSLFVVICFLPTCATEELSDDCTIDTPCNDHGTCDDSSGSIICICETEYSGMRCEDCAEGFQDYGDGNCLPSDPCAEDTNCAALNRVCTNDQGSAVCGSCLAGFHDKAGDCVEDESCLLTSCSGHGVCADTGGVVTCACEAHYEGDHCEACENGYVFWPAGSDTCADDPCDPYPCNVPNAVADGCVQTDVDAFDCTCEAGYLWDSAACIGYCEDVDNDGYGTGSECAGADCDDNDPDVFEGNPEICDGKDNDCDLTTDEDWPDLYQPCDGADSDECPTGTWTCTGDFTGLECTNESVIDIPETCNGEDDDCDGATDEDFSWNDIPLNSPCTPGGVCTEGIVECIPTSAVCSTGPGGSLDMSSAEDCDGVDNDCDGIVDEDCP